MSHRDLSEREIKTKKGAEKDRLVEVSGTYIHDLCVCVCMCVILITRLSVTIWGDISRACVSIFMKRMRVKIQV